MNSFLSETFVVIDHKNKTRKKRNMCHASAHAPKVAQCLEAEKEIFNNGGTEARAPASYKKCTNFSISITVTTRYPPRASYCPSHNTLNAKCNCIKYLSRKSIKNTHLHTGHGDKNVLRKKERSEDHQLVLRSFEIHSSSGSGKEEGHEEKITQNSEPGSEIGQNFRSDV